eukprot:3724791-Pleurochrysis_carterae.AAC.2
MAVEHRWWPHWRAAWRSRPAIDRPCAWSLRTDPSADSFIYTLLRTHPFSPPARRPALCAARTHPRSSLGCLSQLSTERKGAPSLDAEQRVQATRGERHAAFGV